LVLPPTWPQTKTFLWWTTFLISQRRPSYTCLKILKKKLKNWLCSNFFQKSNFFQIFWYYHKLDHKLRPFCDEPFFLSLKDVRAIPVWKFWRKNWKIGYVQTFFKNSIFFQIFWFFHKLDHKLRH
jgi:hypothetical protein